MSEFVVKDVAGFWAVVNNGVIFAQRPSAPEAIGKAVAMATTAAQHNGAKRVIYYPSDTERRVVWDCEKDGFNAE